jgi:hypothetical protein
MDSKNLQIRSRVPHCRYRFVRVVTMLSLSCHRLPLIPLRTEREIKKHAEEAREQNSRGLGRLNVGWLLDTSCRSCCAPLHRHSQCVCCSREDIAPLEHEAPAHRHSQHPAVCLLFQLFKIVLQVAKKEVVVRPLVATKAAYVAQAASEAGRERGWLWLRVGIQGI